MLIPKPKGSQAIPIKHTIAGPPSEDILQKHLEKAYENIGRVIEVNWMLHNPEILCQLQIICDPGGGEPIWTLLKGPPPPPPAQPGEFRPRYVPPNPSWTHQTGYVSLIADTCVVESGGTVDDNVSIAESVIGIKGAAALPGSAASYKPMIFGMTAPAVNYGAPALPATPAFPTAPAQSWTPEQPPPVVQPWSTAAQPESQSWSPRQQQSPSDSGLSALQAALQSSMPEPPTSGELSMVQSSQLVQAIHGHKLTGCLSFLGGNSQQGEIFFAAGEPVHAVAPDGLGDPAFVELLTWQKGRFTYLSSEICEQTTISMSCDQLIGEVKKVADQSKALEFAGITLESRLRRKQSLSSEAEFEQLLSSRGVPVDMTLQKQLFLGADGTVSALQILGNFRLTRAQRIALLYNLVVCDLVAA